MGRNGWCGAKVAGERSQYSLGLLDLNSVKAIGFIADQQQRGICAVGSHDIALRASTTNRAAIEVDHEKLARLAVPAL